MGGRNETCILTNLPIQPHDRVKVFIVINLERSGFKHYCIPFNARYNEYGSIEDIEENGYTQFLLEFFRTKFNKNLEVYNDEEKKIDDVRDLEELCYYIERRLVITANELGYNLELRFCLMDIFEKMVDFKPYIQDITYYREFFQNRCDELLRDFSTVYKKVEDMGTMYKDMIFPHSLHTYAQKPNLSHVISNSVCTLHNMVNKKQMNEYFMACEHDDLKDMTNLMAEAVAFYSIFHYLRKLWEVIPSGSQSTELALHKILHEKSLEYINTQLEE